MWRGVNGETMIMSFMFHIVLVAVFGISPNVFVMMLGVEGVAWHEGETIMAFMFHTVSVAVFEISRNIFVVRRGMQGVAWHEGETTITTLMFRIVSVAVCCDVAWRRRRGVA